MSLPPGSRIGAYEIVSALGAGGMGEVYRARDSQLKRDVALKILPAALSSDPDRLARFQREAEILASLNHANIAHLYGLADSVAAAGQASVRALVMELVDGQTLFDRIAIGPLRIDETLVVSRQISEALETAHERGIIHRDLKPANVKVTDSGIVKVLDFGLAKALEPSSPESAGAATITSPAMTQAGVVIGTAAYMSPEQARGKTCDARTDVWALGCVMFELLTARSPFEGETITDVLGAVVHKEPDWSKLPAETPDRLRRLLQRCLAKDVRQRLHNIADARLEIEDLIAARRSGVSDDRPARHAAPAKANRRELTAWSLAVMSTLSLAVGAWLVSSGRWSAGASPLEAMRVSIVHNEGNEVGVPVISPDGRRVAYAARDERGIPLVWVRDLDQPKPRPLIGTEEGNQLFWSPDSKHLGFVVGGVLKRISPDGGPVVEIARGVRLGAAWGASDILYGASVGLRRVPLSGGATTVATVTPGPDWEHAWPNMLPDGKHFLFTAKHWAGLAESGSQGIYLGSLDDPKDVRQLLPELSGGIYAAPGYIVFARGSRLMAVPFDAPAGRITGEPVWLGEEMPLEEVFYIASVSAAANGTLALRMAPAPAIAGANGESSIFDGELTVFNRDGSVASKAGDLRASYYMAVAPDGKSIIANLTDVRSSVGDLWRVDLISGARTMVTKMRSTGGYVGSPVFSRDGSQLAYGCQPPGTLDDVCVMDLKSGTVTTVFASSGQWEHPRDWSPDGQYLLVDYNSWDAAKDVREIRVLSLKTRKLEPFLATRGQEAVFSPDSKFVAFSGTDTGRSEVYVTTFPERHQTWPVTVDGAHVISWRADGKEILVATLAGQIVAYPVTIAGDSFSTSAPQVLLPRVGFDARYVRATTDHSRLVVRVPKGADKDKGEIRLLFGWQRNPQGMSSSRMLER